MSFPFVTHVLWGMLFLILTWNNEIKHNHCNNSVSNILARHLLGVFCASEAAQQPKNVNHQMQHLFVEKKKIRHFLLFRVHTPEKDCITARRARPTLILLEGSSNTYTWTPAPKSSSTASSLPMNQLKLYSLLSRVLTAPQSGYYS